MGNSESHGGIFQPSEYPWSTVSLNLSKLEIDQAYVVFANNVTGTSVETYTLSDECGSCQPEPLTRVSPKDVTPVTVSTEYPFDIYAGPNQTSCIGAEYGEFGVYNCLLQDTGCGIRCECVEDLEASNVAWPIFFCLLFYLGITLLWFLARFIIRYWREKQKSGRSGSLFLNGLFSLPVKPRDHRDSDVSVNCGRRIRSIDTFRGLALLILIFVDYGNGDYRFLSRGPWNGVYFGDLPVPLLLWIMGLCIPISLQRRLQERQPKISAFKLVLRRSLTIFVIGLCLESVNSTNPDVQTLRILGIPQRFAMLYFVWASIHLLLVKRTSKQPEIIADMSGMLVHWVVALIVTVVYLLVLFLLEVPGCPKGYLGPGGRHQDSKHVNCTGGATMYVDHKILGEDHTLVDVSYKEVYGTTVRFDPEGVLSTLPASLTVLLGMQAGMIMVHFQHWKQRVTRWIIWCIVTGALTTLLSLASKDDGWIPINRNLWSLSFVTFAACLAFFTLTFFYLLVEVLDFYNGAPFYPAGRNAVILYVGHKLAINAFPWTWTNSERPEVTSTHGYRLVLDLWATTLWTLIAVWLHRIEVFFVI